MTNPEISEAAYAMAAKLELEQRQVSLSESGHRAFAKFVQTTSDVANRLNAEFTERCRTHGAWLTVQARKDIKSLILPEPKDPLEECVREAFGPGRTTLAYERIAMKVRAEIEKRGGKITFD